MYAVPDPDGVDNGYPPDPTRLTGSETTVTGGPTVLTLRHNVPWVGTGDLIGQD